MRTLAARYVFPVEGPPIRDGRVSIHDGRIVSVSGPSGNPVDLDLGNVAITPGFVNAHTHLELDPIPAVDEDPEDEVAWLRRVIDSRRNGKPGSGREAAARNVLASLAAGTTTIADTTTVGQSWDAIAASPLRGVVFTELIGLRRERGQETSATAFEWLAKVGSGPRLRPGLSPHAPYSTAGWLYHRAASSGFPLSTHLAEMPEEARLLESRDGPLRSFLEDLGAWDDGWEPVGPRSADFIRRGDLRKADWIVAHGTYFDPLEFWQLRPEASIDGHRVAIAYCPRTHARFGHAPHPYRSMLEKGIVVCLGTDSLASTPTLSVLDEARFLAARDPSASGELLLTMATLFGAWALRLEEQIGSIKPGKIADLAVVALPDRDDADPYRLLLDSDQPVVATMIDGEFVQGPPP